MIFDRLRMLEEKPDEEFIRFYEHLLRDMERRVGIPREVLEEMARRDRERQAHRFLFIMGLLLGVSLTMLLLL